MANLSQSRTLFWVFRIAFVFLLGTSVWRIQQQISYYHRHDKNHTILWNRWVVTQSRAISWPIQNASHTPIPHPDDPQQEEYLMDGSAVIIQWTGLSGNQSLLNFMKNYWSRNLFCQAVHEERNQSHLLNRPIRFEIHLPSCQEMFEFGTLGTGNYITGIYGIRLSAQILSVDLDLTCDDATTAHDKLILPWLMGSFPTVHNTTTSETLPSHIELASATALYNQSSACLTFNHAPIGHLIRDIQFELRRMALAFVDTDVLPHDHPAHQYSIQRPECNPVNQYQLPPQWNDTVKPPTMISSIQQLDDTVIHFRCGDLILSNHKAYAFMRYSAYARYIHPTTRSIGIVTQSLLDDDNRTNNGTAQSRRQDQGGGGRCRLLVMDLAEYLQRTFPNVTRVSIHSEEPMTLSYARMILAQQCIGGFSSFAVFPAVATFGTGYIRRPQNPNGPYRWLTLGPPYLAEQLDNLVIFDEDDVLPVRVLSYVWSTLGAETILQWFRNEISSQELRQLVVSRKQSRADSQHLTNATF